MRESGDLSAPIAFSLQKGEAPARPAGPRRLPFDLCFERAYWFAAKPYARAIVPIELARPGDEQVVAHGQLGLDEPPLSIDRLAEISSVTSLVVDRPVVAYRLLPQIRELIVVNYIRTVDEATLCNLPGLERLCLGPTASASKIDLGALSMPRLRDLRFHAFVIQSIAPLAHFATLERLRIDGATKESIAPLASLSALRFLAVEGWKGMRELGRLEGLEHLELNEVSVSSLSGFRGWRNVRKLWLSGRRLRSLEGIETMRSLEDLGLAVTGVSDLRPLAAAQELRRLVLVHPDRVTDFAAIGALRRLRSLEIRFGGTRTMKLSDISFLRGLDELRELAVEGALVPEDQLAALGRGKPQLAIKYVPPSTDERPGTSIGAVRVERLEEDGVWSIFQDLTGVLGVADNYKAEELIRKELRRREPDLLARLEFDSEADAVGITGPDEKDLRRVAQIIGSIAEHRP